MQLPDFFQTTLASLKTSYALVDTTGCIIEHDPFLPARLLGEPSNLRGETLLETLPELVGQEEAIEQVRQGAVPDFRLDHINRVEPGGTVHYLNLIITVCSSLPHVALIALITDATEQGLHLQQLTQSRNELRLARRQLAQLNDELDYLLRRYLPAEVATALLNGELRPELGGDLRQVSILFADVRGFTTLAEKLAPEQMVQLLNDYLNIVAGAVDELDGVISQFQGDNVMVIFNASTGQPNHAWRAVQTGAALQRAVSTYQARRPPEEARLHFGVGINTGLALVGNIGAHWRYTYTAIGDTVNLAARITAAVPAGEVWLSQATEAQLRGTIPVEPLPPLKFKGRSNSTPLFRVRFI